MNNDKVIETETREVISEVIHAYCGISALALRRTIRKAFPFGPHATDQEKQIWNEAVEQAIADYRSYAQEKQHG